jgi:hypothetical protein
VITVDFDTDTALQPRTAEGMTASLAAVFDRVVGRESSDRAHDARRAP